MRATAESVRSNDVEIIVSPAATALMVQASASRVEVGDTLVITVTAADGQGQPVPGVHVILKLLGPADSLVRWDPLESAPFSVGRYPTPAQWRLIAERVGPLDFTAEVNRFPHHPLVRSDTVRVQIGGRRPVTPNNRLQQQALGAGLRSPVTPPQVSSSSQE